MVLLYVCKCVFICSSKSASAIVPYNAKNRKAILNTFQAYLWFRLGAKLSREQQGCVLQGPIC